jgi:hypothetical protein
MDIKGKVRNFFLTAEVDGRKTEVRTGPEGKDGGLYVCFYIREHGQAQLALKIIGEATTDGKLILTVVYPMGREATGPDAEKVVTVR